MPLLNRAAFDSLSTDLPHITVFQESAVTFVSITKCGALESILLHSKLERFLTAFGNGRDLLPNVDVVDCARGLDLASGLITGPNVVAA